ncbi:MAG: hypothetical protein COB12_10445 [Flavobacterium sp.]|nr:MAG: hypothetical protein COB12_10445 [Flavobacterium sp.]
MKKLFLPFTVVFISVILFSCTSDNTDENSDKYENSITNYIKQKYNTENVTLGESVEVTNQGELYTLTEYFNSKNSNNKTYIVTLGNDKIPAYLINYSSNKIKIDELISGNVEVFDMKENLMDFDLISLANTWKESPNTRGRFWGWSCDAPINFPTGQCNMWCCYYVLGVEVSCGWRECGNPPGNL